MVDTTISPLEIEATIIGLKGVSEVFREGHFYDACLRATRLIRAMADERKAAPSDRTREIADLSRGIQIAHAAWVAMGAPGAWEEDQNVES